MPTPSTPSAPRHLDTTPSLASYKTPLPTFASVIGIVWMVGAGIQILGGLATAMAMPLNALFVAIIALSIAWEVFQLLAGFRLVKGNEMGRRVIRFVLGARLICGLSILPAFLFSFRRFPSSVEFWIFASIMLAVLAAFYALLYACFRHLGSDEVRNACA